MAFIKSIISNSIFECEFIVITNVYYCVNQLLNGEKGLHLYVCFASGLGVIGQILPLDGTEEEDIECYAKHLFQQ